MEKDVKQMSIDDLKPVKTESIDLKQFHNRSVKIEAAEIVQVPSIYTPLIEGSTEHTPQWVLKVKSEVLDTVGEGEDLLEFRATEIFNLAQDSKGKLLGFADHDKSNLAKFMEDIGAKSPGEIIGKEATCKAYDKKTSLNGKENVRTYLKFKY